MNFAFVYNYSIAAVLIAIYLVLPTTILAHAATMEECLPSAQAVCGTATAAPCNGSPCSDEKGSTCCDSTFCCCAFHAPLAQVLRLSYAPVIAIQSFRERSWSLPKVYCSIFVPPQNLA